MIWQNPWAWAGLLVLALPVLIHLLGRRSARVQPFPTLRFLGATRLLVVRRTRLSDFALLAVRLGILAAAVAALAQPLLLTADRERELSGDLARAIILDTSASMMRITRAGEPALETARREASRLAAEAATSVILESVKPAANLEGAVAWLNTQPGRQEILVLSDFQLGTIEQSDLARIAPYTGLRFLKSDIPAETSVNVVLAHHADRQAVARVTALPGRTDIEYSTESALRSGSDTLLLLAGPQDRQKADIAMTAALALGVAPGLDSARAVAIAFPGYEQRAELVRSAEPLNQPWMAEVLARLRRDADLLAAAANAHVRGESAIEPLVPVARTAAGNPAVLAARVNLEEREQLILLPMAEAGSLLSAALIAAAYRALSLARPPSELEPVVVSDDVLEQWQHPATPGALPQSPEGNRESDGRWFWLGALMLLIAESLVRRAKREARPEQAQETSYERVA